MMWHQPLARQNTQLPVILSSLASLPAITCSYSKDEQVAIFTANLKVLQSMAELLRAECGVSLEDNRYVFVGCEEIPGFESVALGQHGDSRTMEAGLCKKAAEVLEQHPKVRAFLLESNELPRYADALRKATGRPIFDAMTLCDFYIDSHLDNPRFGIKDWDDALNKKSAEFDFGQSLSVAAELITKPVLLARDAAMQVYAASMQHAVSMMTRSRRQGIKLGVIRLDYHYEPAPGDVDHPGSYAYEVHYQMVPGLTFELCQSGKMTPQVEAELLKGIKALEAKGVSVITGDCGFMMWYQELVRKNTKLPVIMSSMATLPAITNSFHKGEQIAIFTANGKSLLPMEGLIKEECAVDLKDDRYVFVGCEDIPGFEAVALGEKVDVRKVTPGMVKKAQEVLQAHPKVRAILMECTELPPYSDAVRHVTGVPVFDAITACDFYISSHLDNVKMSVDLANQFWMI
ncbi:ALMA5 [Symbiodinium natans]|uniref:ALMA5 protein n=1 Tax=Symbiodinium natans TaxID=878477 RepID=A0A812LZ63_9DINO|nr:ALMA5 [Symbiodinium natans]